MLWWWGHGLGWGIWFGMSVLSLLFWVAVVWLVVTLIRNSSRTGGAPPAPPAPPAGRRAEDVLAERFARGEIDEAEYHDRLRVLRETAAQEPRR
ncbi:MAG: SHOCT domain-containing protein [Frankiaceae bacterium]